MSEELSSILAFFIHLQKKDNKTHYEKAIYVGCAPHIGRNLFAQTPVMSSQPLYLTKQRLLKIRVPQEPVGACHRFFHGVGTAPNGKRRI